MWLSRIKDQFKAGQYASIGEFVADLRLMLENCYRYNGPGHPVTRKGLRLEQVLPSETIPLNSGFTTPPPRGSFDPHGLSLLSSLTSVPCRCRTVQFP